MPENKHKLQSINPATEEVLEEFPLITDEELEGS
jgi:acyl-CoA reductase-like NAD-dependent aldehyde dehydrogenase